MSSDSIMRAWWIPAVRGVLAIAFGVLALLWPHLTLLALAALFAAYALMSGIVGVVGAFRLRGKDDNWWMILLIGLVGIAAGIITMIHPGLTALVLVVLMAANALVTGCLEIASAVRLRKEINNEWMLILSGLVSVAFGIAALLFPALGALALVWLVSLYAVITGVFLLSLSMRMRSLQKSAPNLVERRTHPDRRVSTVAIHS